MDIKKIGKTVALLRKRQGLSQQDLAKKVNVSNKTISKWECGNSLPDIESLDKIAKVFELTLDELVNYKIEVPQNMETIVPQIKEKKSPKKGLLKALIVAIIASFLTMSISLILVLGFLLIPRAPRITNSDLFSIDKESNIINCSVSNDMERFSFDKKISVPFGNKWEVYYDLGGTIPINSKTVDLNVGNNNFYIVVENYVGNKKTYDVTIRRKPIYSVTISDGTWAKTERLEEGTVLNMPDQPTKAGYDFVGWNCTFPYEVKGNSTIKPIWNAHKDTKYSVEYYLQNIEDDNFTLFETKRNLTGETGKEVNATIKRYANFTFCEEKSITKGNINGEGTLTLKVYYTRNKFNVNVAKGGIVNKQGTYKYGTILNIGAIANLGYDFDGWYSNGVLVSNESNYAFTIDRDIEAKFKVKPEMEKFLFSSTTGSCNITGIKEKTLADIEIPEYVTTIGEKAFQGNTSLNSVKIPRGVVSIGKMAFEGCTSLKEVQIDSIDSWLNKSFEDSYANPLSMGASLLLDGIELTELIIPNGITTVNAYAFYKYSKITKIELPMSINSIEDSAFAGCSALTKIELPIKITMIGNGAFGGCTGLTEIIIPNSVVSIGSNAFYNCSNLSKVLLPNGITTISSGMFKKCSNLKSVSIPEGVKTIGQDAFENCTSLESIEIPKSVTSIGLSATYGCSALRKIYYKGDSNKWAEITIQTLNSPITMYSTRYYYAATQPENDGKYYHYDINGNIVIW